MANKRLFGTFGVRRIANEVLNPEFASRLAACYGTLVQGTVAIGGDTRTSTPMLKHAITAGLLSSGCDVIDLGILPTPAIQYAVRTYYDGGIIVTASHNPPKYNGLKFVDEFGIGTPDNMELKIEELYFDKEPKRAKWDEMGKYCINESIIDEYIEETLKKRKVFDMLVENAVFVDAPETVESIEAHETINESEKAEEPEEDKE